MSGRAWTPAELKKLKKLYDKRPNWKTDYVLAGELASTFHRSPESIRWQLKQFHREAPQVQATKILLMDIETRPIKAWVWDVWKQDIHPSQVIEDWSILCWSAKWLFDDTVMGESVTPEEAKSATDGSILPGIWNLLNEADIVIGHNSKNFDIKRLYTRFFLAGMPKPMYFQNIDSLEVAKSNFSFTYNKLDWIGQITGVGRKIETEFFWWDKCASGDKKYLDMMLDYNKQDVQLEEEVYMKLRPWMDKHPNLNVYSGTNFSVCPKCGTTNLHWNGKYATPLGLYRAFRCEDCGSIGRSTKKQYKIKSALVQN